MNITRIVKKTDFYLVILTFYMVGRLWYKSYIEFDVFRLWENDILTASLLLVCVIGWKAYRLLLLKNKIIL